MAFRKKPFRKPGAKKAYRKRTRPVRRYRKRVQTIGAKPLYLPAVVPTRLMTKMSYSDVKELTATYPTIAYNTYRTASLYDPDYTGAGVQPGWFDFIKGAYRAYIVHGCKIQLVVTNKSTEVARVQTIVSTASDGPISTASDWESLSSLGTDQLIPGDSGSRRISRYVDNFKVQGMSKNDARLTQSNPLVSTMTSSPTLSPYFQIKAECADLSGTFSVVYRINITYYVEFFDRKLTQGVDV